MRRGIKPRRAKADAPRQHSHAHYHNEAVKTLDEMIAVLDQEGLNDRRIRGAALHARANRLAQLHRHVDAFRDATEAVKLQKGLLGAEAEFISSLHLASVEAQFIGDTEKAGVFAAEAAKLTGEFRSRISSLPSGSAHS